MTCRIRRVLFSTCSALALALALSLSLSPLGAQAPTPAPTGTMAFANMAPEARAALEAALDAYQALDWSVAFGHATKALAVDSTLGLARSLLAFLRGGPTAAAENRRAVVDWAGRPVADLTWVVANRFAGANRAALLAAAKTILPNDRRLAYEYANALAGNARLDSLRALAARFPDFAAPRIQIANLLTTLVSPMPSPAAVDEALRWSQEAVRIAPNLSSAHGVFGQVLERAARHAEAMPHLTQATRLEPKNEFAYVLKAEIALREGNPVLARAAMDSAIAGTPHVGRRADYRENRAVLFLHDGRLREMMDDLGANARDAEAAGLGAAPGLHATMSVVAAGVRDVAGATAHLAEARRLNLAAGTLADAECVVYFLTRQAVEARRALGDYVRLAATQAAGVREENIHRMTGLTLVAEAKYAEAIPELKQGGVNPYAQLGLIEAYTALGQRQVADSVRTAVFAQKDVSYISTARPIIKYRAANPGR